MQEGGGWATQWKRPRCHLQFMLLPPASLIPVESCYIYKGLLHCPPPARSHGSQFHTISPPNPSNLSQSCRHSSPFQIGSTDHVRKADQDQGFELGQLNLTHIHSALHHNSYAFRSHQAAKTQQDFFPTQRQFSTFREFLCLS